MKKIVFMLVLPLLIFAETKDINAIVENVKSKTKEFKKQTDGDKKKKENQDNLLDYKEVELNEQSNNEGGAEETNMEMTGSEITGEQRSRENTEKQKKQKKQEAKKQKFAYSIPRGAKTIDMTAEAGIQILKQKISVITFPFLITGIEQTDFIRDEKNNKKSEIDDVEIKVEDNKVTIKSETIGTIDLLIRGGDYPILLHIYVNIKTGANYYAFVDTMEDEKSKKPKSLNADNHEEMLVGIAKAMYLNEKITGFKEDNRKVLFDMKEYDLQMVRLKAIQGQGYLGEVWEVINKGRKSIKLSEEIFYTDGVYFISLVSDIVSPKKSTKMLVIRKP